MAVSATTPSKSRRADDELVSAEQAADPEFAAEWERLSLARVVAARLVGYRSDNGFSQRALAQLLGVSEPRAVELESGEKNPQVETLVKIAAVTGLEFAIDIVPVGQAPKLVGKALTRNSAHVYAGASVLVASK